MELSSAQEYLKLFNDLKDSLPALKKAQGQPDKPESKDKAITFLWTVKVLYGKVKDNKALNIPHNALLDNLDKLPNDKEAFAKQVKENMLEVRNNVLQIKTPTGEAQPIADFGNDTLNQIENWGLALLGTFGGKK
jgi:hypothetical protein